MTMGRLWQANERVSIIVLVLAGSLLIWELAVHALNIPQFLLPAPTVVIAELWKSPGLYLHHLLATLRVTMTGFGLAVVFGVLLAVLIVHSRFMEHMLYTLLVALNSLPKVALAPLFVMWLGTGGASKTTVAVTIAIFPIVIDTALGLRSIEPDVMNMARVMRASRWQILRRIRFPHALPALFAGMKVAISLALVGTIVGEFVAGGAGLGSAILSAQGTFDTPQVFASILLLGVMGTVLFYGLDFIERRLIPWHSSQRAIAISEFN
ncbi:MAG: ABC transporter permease [Pseudolabrys sp.]